MAETRRDWEVLQENATDRTERLRINGGWLYRVITYSNSSVALVFVPAQLGE